MKISVITPSFNQAQFLPFNLASVGAQQGVNIEHIVVDPGSKDGSTEIARQAPGVILIAEPDRGQSDGISKGFSRSTGDILVWLNSDDFYPDEHVLASVVQCFLENPDVDIVYGDVNFVDESGAFLCKGFVNKNSDLLLDSFQYQVGIVQPGVFWRRRVFEEIGGPSDTFEYCMDYELWVRMASKGYKWKYIPKVLAHHRWWGGMKTSSRRDLSLREHFKVCDRYFNYVHWKWLDRYADYLCSNQDGVVNHASSIDPEEKAVAIRRAVDEVVTQEMLRKLYLATKPELVATHQYIQDHYPEKTRIYFQQAELEIASEYSDDPKAQQRVAWNIFDVTTSNGKRLAAYHVPENFDRYFDHDWHVYQLGRAREALGRLQKERRGDVCVIVGNGPSLRKSDLSLLANTDTIMSNFAVMSHELRRYSKILTVVNDLVAKQGAIDFNASHFIKFVPFWLANYFNEDENTFFVNATVRPEFGIDFVGSASWRSTVSFFNMQLACAIGYRKVILIGFDHSYVQPKGVVEGVVINQVDDDENHFDPRYFKGKDWQAADTANMEKMYVVAKAAYEEDRREIVNCTVGGKLEVFRRGDLATELGVKNPIVTDSRLAMDMKSFSRLLMIDSTPIGHASATGQLKQTFLGDWPKRSFLQIWESDGQKSALHAIELGQSIESSRAVSLAANALIEKCKAFQPDVIYFRPVDSENFFDIAEQIVAEIGKPLVIHMMDDWPERLRLSGAHKYSKLDAALRRFAARATKHLSICEAMSATYKVRYGGDWLPLANGVDPTEFPAKDWTKRAPVSPTNPFVIRYMGGLADDMTYASVKDIALAVLSLQEEYPIRFEIYTMDYYRSKAERELGVLPGVFVGALVDEVRYQPFLCEADALVIAYNFDAKSIGYIGLSLANKMPECLVTGVPLLAYGSPEVATIDYLKKAGCALVVDSRNRESLRTAIRALVTQPDHFRQLGASARAFVAKNLTKKMVQQKFRDAIILAKGNTIIAAQPCVGPFERQQSAHYDETEPAPTAIAQAQSGVQSFKVERGVNFTQLSANQWRYTHSDSAQKLWEAIFAVVDTTAGRSFVASIRLKSNKAMTVDVSIGRYGNTDYEGSKIRITLDPGPAQSVQVRKEFANPHTALKIQMDVLELQGGGTADLTIDSVYINESLTSIRRRMADADLNLSVANRLFREGDYSSAMGLNLLLYQQRPALQMYPDNALMAARKLGMDSVRTADDLLQVLQ